MSRPFEARTPLEALVVEQALLLARQLQQTADDAPDGQVLARVEALTVPATRELARQALAEFIGTALLLIAIVGSGIAAQRLSPHDTGLELLENAAATGAALMAIILAVGPVDSVPPPCTRAAKPTEPGTSSMAKSSPRYSKL